MHLELQQNHDAMVLETLKQLEYTIAANVNPGSFLAQFFLSPRYGPFSKWTIWQGFWNPKQKKHSRAFHFQAGITQSPQEVLQVEAYRQGYSLKWITRMNAIITPLPRNKLW